MRALEELSAAFARTSGIGGRQNYDLWTTARSEIRNILRRFPDQPLEEVEFNLHLLWDIIIRNAIITTADDPVQDRLVMEVVLARELGSLGPNAMTADGEVWSGLPFLARHVFVAWLEKSMYLNEAERLSLAAFTAKLVAAGVRAPELGFCAVLVLRATLETPFTVTEHGSGKSVAELLPVAVAWFNFAGHKLAAFSGGHGHEPLSGEEGRLATVGQLAQEAGILEPGFSTKRWHFWQQRLKALSLFDDWQISRPALQAKSSMDMWSKYVGLVAE